MMQLSSLGVQVVFFVLVKAYKKANKNN